MAVKPPLNIVLGVYPVHNASCLCGTVRISVGEIVGDYVYCHCASCRKSSGTAFAANVSIPIESFVVTAGESQISTYESTPGKVRHFCNNCGSPLFTKVGSNPRFVRLRLGILDSPYSKEPVAHIFTGEKATWEHISDSIPHHKDWPTKGSVSIHGSHQPDA